MRAITMCLIFLCMGSRLFGAEEFGTVRRVFTVEGYDDNDVIQMAAVVEPPPRDGRALKFERMLSEVDLTSRTIRLRSVYGPAETPGGGRQTVSFPVGRLPNGRYEIFADRLPAAELIVSLATTKSPDSYLYPKLLNLGVTQHLDGRLVLSFLYERRARERLSEIHTHIYSDYILVLPIMKIIDEEIPTTFSTWQQDRAEIRLQDLPRTFALLIKGRTSEVGTVPKTSDILKIVNLDATQATLPKGIRYLSEGIANLILPSLGPKRRVTLF
jgi:hypothetical protein